MWFQCNDLKYKTVFSVTEAQQSPSLSFIWSRDQDDVFMFSSIRDSVNMSENLFILVVFTFCYMSVHRATFL